jgi:hypothetical protein
VPIISQQYPKVIAAPAPAPSDIIWANMSATPDHTENVAYVTSMFYFTGKGWYFASEFRCGSQHLMRHHHCIRWSRYPGTCL